MGIMGNISCSCDEQLTEKSLDCSPSASTVASDGGLPCDVVRSNLLHLCRAEGAELANCMLRSALSEGKVEFFCGSGVGYNLTGVDWVGLVNKGASKLLERLPKDIMYMLEEGSALSGGSGDLELVRSCFDAFKEGGSSKDQKAV